MISKHINNNNKRHTNYVKSLNVRVTAGNDPKKLSEYNMFVNISANFTISRSRMYLNLGHTD